MTFFFVFISVYSWLIFYFFLSGSLRCHAAAVVLFITLFRGWEIQTRKFSVQYLCFFIIRLSCGDLVGKVSDAIAFFVEGYMNGPLFPFLAPEDTLVLRTALSRNCIAIVLARRA